MIFRYRIEWEIEAETLKEAKEATFRMVLEVPDTMTATMEVLEAVEESLLKKTFE